MNQGGDKKVSTSMLCLWAINVNPETARWTGLQYLSYGIFARTRVVPGCGPRQPASLTFSNIAISPDDRSLVLARLRQKYAVAMKRALTTVINSFKGRPRDDYKGGSSDYIGGSSLTVPLWIKPNR
jgi:hypothetical protein